MKRAYIKPHLKKIIILFQKGILVTLFLLDRSSWWKIEAARLLLLKTELPMVDSFPDFDIDVPKRSKKIKVQLCVKLIRT